MDGHVKYAVSQNTVFKREDHVFFFFKKRIGQCVSRTPDNRCLVKVWTQAKLQSYVKHHIDAIARVHSALVTMLIADWVSLMTQAKETVFQTQSYEATLIRLRIVRRETGGRQLQSRSSRACGVSRRRRKQAALKPEPSRQPGLHLERSMPNTIEDLRTPYRVMGNIWLLAQLREELGQLESFGSDSTCREK